MIVETLLGLALAAGVIGIILVVKVLVSHAEPVSPGVERVTVLCGQGDAPGLEWAVRDAVSRRGAVYIVSGGLNREALRRAEILALRYGAELTDVKDLTEELRRLHGRESACGDRGDGQSRGVPEP